MQASLLTLICYYTHALFILSFFFIHPSHGRLNVSSKHPLEAGSLPRSYSSSLTSPSGTLSRRRWHSKKKSRMGGHTSTPKRDSLGVIRERRVNSIIRGLNNGETKVISRWLETLDSNGKWPDSEVDYTTGCEARRANWPAQDHWRRIVLMTAAWYGGLHGHENYAKDEALRAAISLAIDYWFSRDFPGTACLGSGGKSGCPCSNPNNYLWNTNWYSNVILIPGLVGQTCLLLDDTLSSAQLQSCIRMTKRSYEYKVSELTGANTLDVASIGMDQALLTGNVDLLTDAYRRSHKELVIMDALRADGIRPDGAFGQHDGLLYNGNYGKVYTKDVLDIETYAAGTEFAADTASQSAFATLMEGNRWMIIRNTVTGVLHWDFSALGRFISFPIADKQATGSVDIDLKLVGDLGRSWQSQSLIDFENSLSDRSSSANAGNLVGNRMFYTNDYMVHRGQNYVSTIKMWSSRTRNSECINSQNPLGFHLADGVTYTYLRGDEYEDIAAAWDWNRIPGITTDYGATPLTCKNTNKLLGIEAFVGGTSDGQVGIAVMRYTNPVTKSFHFQKVWFFLEDDVQHVMVSDISSTSPQKPAISVLDQRRQKGPVIVDGTETDSASFSAARSLWHGGVGYKFSEGGSALSVEVGPRTGDWSKIGISEQPPVTVDLFSAWILHQGSESSSLSYTIFPGVGPDTFAERSHQCKLRTVQDDRHISAIYDEAHETFMAAFWDTTGGSVSFTPRIGSAPITIAVNANSALIFKLQDELVTVSDPSQSLSNVEVSLSREGTTKALVFTLPRGGEAGKSVTKHS
ncbi:Chondroitinase-AC [Hypsizygus marmoreus]|uniref:Chondroitinase-AC n=1 Tax=Hypsizygus marmoreus TaxID=39966 RepID=A0A369JBN7_HYPMA|nr:Chondroitinase-AC [Hypsizygus marmoreus]